MHRGNCSFTRGEHAHARIASARLQLSLVASLPGTERGGQHVTGELAAFNWPFRSPVRGRSSRRAWERERRACGRPMRPTDPRDRDTLADFIFFFGCRRRSCGYFCLGKVVVGRGAGNFTGDPRVARSGAATHRGGRRGPVWAAGILKSPEPDIRAAIVSWRPVGGRQRSQLRDSRNRYPPVPPASYPSNPPAAETNALFSFKKFCKIFQIFRHIESLDACIEY